MSRLNGIIQRGCHKYFTCNNAYLCACSAHSLMSPCVHTESPTATAYKKKQKGGRLFAVRAVLLHTAAALYCAIL